MYDKEILGQLTGFAICNIGRRPEYFHPLVVKALFNKDIFELNSILEIDDSELKSVLEKIDCGIYDNLHDMSICPSGDKDESKRLFTISFTILKHFGAINQFKMGLKCINGKLIHTDNYKIMQYFLQNKSNILTLKQFMDILKYHNDDGAGSNLHNQVADAICDFEVFLAGVSNGYYEVITLKEVLFFVASVDKIPPFGLEKKIDVRFDNNVSLPQASQCSLTLTLPFHDITNKMILALKFGVGFGDI